MKTNTSSIINRIRTLGIVLAASALGTFSASAAVTTEQLGRMLLRTNYTQVNQDYNVFYMVKQGRHPGIDYRSNNHAVYSPVSGVVASIDASAWGRVSIKIDGTNDYFMFMHMSSFNVRAGERVVVGGQVGISGDVGARGAPHLHVEVRTGTTTPAHYFPGRTGSTGSNKNPTSVVNLPANRAPVFSWLATPTINAGAITVSFSASDPDGDNLGYDIYVLGTNGTEYRTNVLAVGSRVVNQGGTTSYTFAANDLINLVNGGSYYARVDIYEAGKTTPSAQRTSSTFTYTRPNTTPAMTLSASSVSLPVTQYGTLPPWAFTIRNSGTGTLSYSASDDASWMSVSPSSGTSTGETDTLNVNFNTSGYSAGTLNGTITVNGGSAGSRTISVRVTITAAPTTTDDHGNTISNATTISRYSNLAGNLERGGDEDMFRIVVSSSNTVSFYTTGNVDTVGHLLNSSGQMIDSNDDTGGINFRITRMLSPGTYFLRVRAFGSSGTGAYRVYVN
jgi:hypothetical protein